MKYRVVRGMGPSTEDGTGSIQGMDPPPLFGSDKLIECVAWAQKTSNAAPGELYGVWERIGEKHWKAHWSFRAGKLFAGKRMGEK